jgi:UDP-N-acetylmuramoyl-tripeptide--D-alanyl-D-alanine ligase
MATPLPRITARFTLGEVAAATAGELSGDPSMPLTGVSTDSRALAPGGLFVALRGERFDGHTHLAAPSRGARGRRWSSARTTASRGPAVVVDDTLRALGDLARAHLRRHRGSIARCPSWPSAARWARPPPRSSPPRRCASRLRAVPRDRRQPQQPRGRALHRCSRSPSAHRAAVIECGSNAPGRDRAHRGDGSARRGAVPQRRHRPRRGRRVGRGVADEEGAVFAHARRAVVGNADEPVSARVCPGAQWHRARWLFGLAPEAHVG